VYPGSRPQEIVHPVGVAPAREERCLQVEAHVDGLLDDVATIAGKPVKDRQRTSRHSTA
jgi:hypothetical protein